jgi:hypothetical protein
VKESIDGEYTDEELAGHVIFALAKKYPKSFDWAGKKLGYPAFIKHRMDAYTAACMWSDANIPIRSQRIILRYIFGYFGFRLTCPQREIDKLASHLVLPIHGETKVGQEKISHWYRPIDDVVINLLENEWNHLDFHRMDIVFGGDHGQSVFGAAVKIILWSLDWTIVASSVQKIGHIECAKDTYEILKATIAGDINQSLKRIKGKVLRVCKDSCGCTATFERQDDRTEEEDTNNPLEGGNIPEWDDSSSSSDDSPREKGDPNPQEKVSCHETQVFAIGDLAFVSMSLGKINMGGRWCYLCDLHPEDWCELIHRNGNPWTLSRMRRRIEQIENKSMRDKPVNRRGCIEETLFDVFEPSDYIPPCLHIMMGAFNDAINGMLSYIDIRREGEVEGVQK